MRAVENRAADVCFGLKGDDCSLLRDALKGDALNKLNAFQFEYGLMVKIKGEGDATNIDLNTTGTGTFSTAAGAIGKLLGGDINPATNSLQLTLKTTNALKAPSFDLQDTLDLRIVAGVLYFKGAALGIDGWRSVELLERNSGSGRTGLGGIMRALRALNALNRFHESLARFINAARVDDDEISGQKIAVFRFTVDLPRLLSSIEFYNLIKALGELEGTTVKDADLRETLTILGAILNPLKFSYTRWVGTQDRLIHGLGLSLIGNLEPSVIGPLAGGGAPNANNALPLNLNAQFQVRLSEIGEAVPVNVPEGATPIAR